MKEKSLKLNAILNVIKTLMGLIFPLITFPYASRILLPEGLGKVNFANSIVSYFAMIASLGIETYGVREAAKVRDDKILLSQFTKEIFTINMISTVISYILFAIAVFFIPKFVEYRTLLIVSGATILFSTLGINWLYSAVEDYAYITVRSIIFQFISLGLLFLFVKTKDDYIKYAAISVISSVGSNILNFLHSRKYITIKTGLPIILKKHIKPILILFAMAIAVKIYTVLDTIMLGFMCDDFEVGVYTAATKINKLVLTLVVAVITVFMPRLSYYARKDDKHDFWELTYKGFDLLFLMALPCTLGLSLLSEEVVLMFCGKEYSAAILPMKIMNPIIIIIGISTFVGINIFLSIGKELYKLYSVIIGAVINFILNSILIPKYGSIGASIATVVAEFSVMVVQLFLLMKFMSLKRIGKTFVQYSFYSMLMILPLIPCKIFISNIILRMTICCLCGIVLYFLILLFSKNAILWSFFRKLKKRGADENRQSK